MGERGGEEEDASSKLLFEVESGREGMVDYGWLFGVGVRCGAACMVEGEPRGDGDMVFG